jgi:hypothetical protein
MFDSGMRESQQLEVDIRDHSYAVFLAFLEYLYTDDVKVRVRLPLAGVTSGIKCWMLRGRVQDLSSQSSTPSTRSIEFAMDLLALADQFLVDPLKWCVCCFVSRCLLCARTLSPSGCLLQAVRSSDSKLCECGERRQHAAAG